MAIKRRLAYEEGFAPWWLEPKETVHEAIVEVMEMMGQDSGEIKRQRLYDRFESRYFALKSVTLINQPMQMNVCQAVVDAAAAQIAGNKTDVMCLTKEGDPAMQARAKKLNQFLEGCFNEVNQYQIAQDMFVNNGKHGTSVHRVYADPGTGCLCAKSIEPCNFVVPPQKSSQSPLDQCFEYERIPYSQAITRWPGKERDLQAARPIAERDQRNRSLYRSCRGVGDYVYVVHAWRRGGTLPDGKSYRGRHVVCTDNATLEDNPLDDAALPYSIGYWTRQTDNFWGLGVIHRIDPIQDELDHLCWKIQEHMRHATSFLFFQKGSIQEVARITNQIWQKLFGTGPAPQVINMPPIDGAYFQERDHLWQRAFDLSGVSPLAAQGLKPAGINSGKALRLYKDVANQRLKLPVDNFDRLNVDVADRLITLAKKVDAEGDGLEVMAKTGRGVTPIKWSEVDMDRDHFRLQMYPTSFLDQTPSGKLDDITDMLKAFPELQPFALKAMDFPDIEAFTGLATARADEVEAAMEAITVHGRYVGPDPQTDLALAIPYCLSTLARGTCDNLGEDTLDMLRQYLVACQNLQKAAMPPAPAGPPPGAAPTMGMPPPPGGAPMPPMPPPGA